MKRLVIYAGDNKNIEARPIILSECLLAHNRFSSLAPEMVPQKECLQLCMFANRFLAEDNCLKQPRARKNHQLKKKYLTSTPCGYDDLDEDNCTWFLSTTSTRGSCRAILLIHDISKP